MVLKLLFAKIQRGLPFLEPPEVAIIPADAFEQRIRDRVAADLDPDEIAAEDTLYRLLGMLEGNTDLLTLILDVLGDQVVGFYDERTGELVVPGVADLSVYERTVIVHELVHALGDQHFMFGDEFRRLRDAELFEQAAALQALVEGGATYAKRRTDRATEEAAASGDQDHLRLQHEGPGGVGIALERAGHHENVEEGW